MEDRDSDWPAVREVRAKSSDKSPEQFQSLYQRSIKFLILGEAGKLNKNYLFVCVIFYFSVF